MNPQDAERELNELAARAGMAGSEGEDAVAELLGRVRPMVVRYCRARLGRSGGGAYTTADDVAQEVCLAVLHALPRYRDLGRPFTAFVFGIAAHKVSDAHRGAARDLSQPVDILPEIEDTEGGPEARVLAGEQARRLNELLETLPPVHRDVVVLRVAVGLSAEEAGRALGMSAGAIRVTQHRALAKLRQRIGEEQEVPA